ncbi:MAG TPA: 4-hydroxy-tetrahydrodipicolinate reductase [Parafilimonas sp.]|nr:4-hydroxy-tetrahydrodipicolinate reductase [Parafilimonas sp.]
MKIALIGYGKMGKAIEEIANKNGDEIVLKISSSNKDLFTIDNIKKADVAIEFTNPHSAVDNIKKCIDAGVPVVTGSTGWLKQFDEVVNYCKQKKGCFLYASNFSVGVNIFFEVNKILAGLMSKQKDYNVTIEEIHHTQKKDAPSGTAITIAEQILQRSISKKEWVNKATEDKSQLQIISKRIENIPGTHKVLYHSFADDIEIIHTAHNRSGFASGALQAAKFIIGKKGIFEMKDVLGF